MSVQIIKKIQIFKHEKRKKAHNYRKIKESIFAAKRYCVVLTRPFVFRLGTENSIGNIASSTNSLKLQKNQM